jgi:hypothetical protein
MNAEGSAQFLVRASHSHRTDFHALTLRAWLGLESTVVNTVFGINVLGTASAT